MHSVKPACILLGALAALAVRVIAAPQLPGIATTSANIPGVDVHSHFYSPAYFAALNATGHGQPDGTPFIPVSAKHILWGGKILTLHYRNGLSNLT